MSPEVEGNRVDLWEMKGASPVGDTSKCHETDRHGVAQKLLAKRDGLRGVARWSVTKRREEISRVADHARRRAAREQARDAGGIGNFSRLRAIGSCEFR